MRILLGEVGLRKLWCRDWIGFRLESKSMWAWGRADSRAGQASSAGKIRKAMIRSQVARCSANGEKVDGSLTRGNTCKKIGIVMMMVILKIDGDNDG